VFEKIVGDYYHSMRQDDMDLQTMQEVYKLVRQRRGQSIQQVIRKYNETYFREVIWTLEVRAWQMTVAPDVLHKLTQPFQLQG